MWLEVAQPNGRLSWLGAYLLVVLVLVLAMVYFLRPPDVTNTASDIPAETVAEAEVIKRELPSSQRIILPDSYTLPVKFGDLGPLLLKAGAIDYDRFVDLYQRAGNPLSEEQFALLEGGSDRPVILDNDSAYFLLNFLWAAGLTNKNPLLESGPMMEYSEGDIGRFASTGGWGLGTRPATKLYASADLAPLTAVQQASLEEVAYAVYRPCCDNHTAFADCNHGMAMLGLLELMAAQGASVDEMFAAAKMANRFWFPQQTFRTAVFFRATMDLAYGDVDPRMAVGPEVFSGSGHRFVTQWLADNGITEQGSGGGNSCGV